MYFCYLCKKKANTAWVIIKHLRLDHNIKDSKFMDLKCIASEKCKLVFSSFSGLYKHTKKCSMVTSNLAHAAPVQRNEFVIDNSNIVSESVTISNNPIINETPNLSVLEGNQDNSASQPNEVNVDLNTFDVNKFASSLNVLGLPDTNISKILDLSSELVTNMTNSLINAVNKIDEPISQSNVSETISSVGHKFKSEIEKFKTKYKRRKNFTHSSTYVKPKEISLGTRWDTKYCRKSKKYRKVLVKNTFQYISIKETLMVLLSNEHFIKFLKSISHTCDKEIIFNFCCGKRCEEVDIFKDNPNAIYIQLFYDDFECTNPLGPRRTIHKLGGIYFSVRNLTSSEQSRLENIFLVALFHVNDLKKNKTYNDVLKPLFNDLKELETEGITTKFGHFKCGLTSVVHDNLGGNLILGFQPSFNANYFCRFCEILKSDIQSTFEENENLLRTTESILTNLSNNDKGIQFNSILNRLKSFNVISNGTVDPMHDLLEGCIPYIILAFLNKLVSLKLITFEEINNRIHEFNFGCLYRKNIPTSGITKDNLRLSASQAWCLLVHFPFIFGDLVSEPLQAFWEGITTMLQIAEICFSKFVSFSHIQQLKNLITQHLKIIVEVYDKRLLPKHHILLHYPRVMSQLGPISHLSAMRYESFHAYLKSMFQKLKNSINLCKTLAIRNQQKFSIDWGQYKFLKQTSLGKLSKVSSEFLIEYDDVLKSIGVHGNSLELYQVNFIENIVQYRPSLYIISLNNMSLTPNFLRIREIISYKDNLYLIFNEVKTIRFDAFHNSFEIEDNSTISFYEFSKMHDNHQIFDSITSRKTGKNYILKKMIV